MNNKIEIGDYVLLIKNRVGEYYSCEVNCKGNKSIKMIPIAILIQFQKRPIKANEKLILEFVNELGTNYQRAKENKKQIQIYTGR